jgi:hypothetical protein
MCQISDTPALQIERHYRGALLMVQQSPTGIFNPQPTPTS